MPGSETRLAATLPHVDRRLVEIARALATRPAVLLLDEPAAGLDEADTVKLGGLLQRLARAGLAVVLVEHDMSLVMSISDEIVVLDAGRRIASGVPAAVRNDPAVKAAYLGSTTSIEPLAPRAPGAPLLDVRDLNAGYGPLSVLHQIGLRVGRGETTAGPGPERRRQIDVDESPERADPSGRWRDRLWRRGIDAASGPSGRTCRIDPVVPGLWGDLLN